MNGELNDAEQAQASAAYTARLEAILPQLPEPVAELAALDLHDACIEAIVWEPASKRLELSVVVWRPAGYQGVALTYGGALLGERSVQTLRDVARDRETQILASEIDCGEDGILNHKLLFWPRDELTIDFTELSLQITGRPDERVNLLGFFSQINPDDD